MKPICFWLWLVLPVAGFLHAATPGGTGPRPTRIEPPAYWAPLVFKPGAATERSYRADEIKWFEKHLIPAISKPWEGQPWKEQALAFVRERLPYLQWRHAWDPRPAVKIEAKVLQEAGCADPWVRLLAALLSNAPGWQEEMTQAFGVIRDSGLDPALLRFAALPLLMYKVGGEEEREILLDLFTDWTAGLGKSPCYAGKDGDLLFRHIRKLPKFRFEATKLLPRLKESNTMPAWIVDTIAGEAEVNLAWDSRGSGWASSVTEEGWKGFHEHLTLARKHLVAAWQAKPDQPHAAAQMIVVVMGDGAKRGENERLWFDRATAACFDYESAYARYRQALLPRWGGSYETMLAFGLACADSKRFDTYAPATYFEVLNQMAEELNDYAAVYRLPEVAPRVKALNAALLEAATPEEKGNRQSFIILDSWLTGDWDTGYTALAAVGAKTTDAISSKLNKLGVSLVKVVNDTGLYGAAGGTLARQANAREEAGDFKAALVLWEQWRQAYSGPPEFQAAGEVRIRAAALRRDYAAGQWIKLPVDQPEDWDWTNGTWESSGKDGLTAVGTERSDFYCAVYPLPAGEHFELRAKFTLSPLVTGRVLFPQVHLGFNPWSNYGSTTATVSIGSGGYWGYLSANTVTDRAGEFLKIGATPPENLEIYLRRTKEGLTYVVNGKPVMEKTDLAAGAPDWDRGHFALGVRGLLKGMKMSVTSVELHRLP